MVLTLLSLSGCVGQVITRVTPTVSATATVGLTQAATLRPTATPAPYTPAPTATPTVTPTPIIYAIQAGDSLLKIASEFGISVQGLQETNGITDPRTLQIGQELIIPREELRAEGTPTATPTPLPFVVENISFNHSPLGGLWCFGEVHNTTDQDLEQAGVTVTLLDEQGEALSTIQGYVQLMLIGRGERAPFAARFPEPPVSFAGYTAYPWVGLRGYVGNYYRDLAIQDAKGEGERYATYTVTGTVVNTGPEDAIGVMVSVTLYDSLGRVIGTRYAPPDHNVIPRTGQTTFSLRLTPAGGPVDHFSVSALGRRLPTPTPNSN